VVITGSPTGELKANNPDNGAVARSFGFSILAHPALKGEQLLLGTNEGEVLLINQNGDILKKVKISDKAVSAVVWWKENIVAATFDGKIRSIDPLTMNVIAEFAMGYDYSAVFSDMIVSEDFLAIYSSRNRLYLFH
jgi:outer membrane protein assembly factor BamB